MRGRFMGDRLLPGKRCLLVGGAGGLGRAAARRFLGEGARLVLADESQAGAEAVADLAGLGEVSALACDATEARQVSAAVQETVARLGGLDVLYHLVGGS